MFISIPWTAAEKASMRGYGRGDRGYLTCLLCDRPVNHQSAVWVHEVEGGGLLAPADLDYQNEAADLGWWMVGPDCAARIPAGYSDTKRRGF